MSCKKEHVKYHQRCGSPHAGSSTCCGCDPLCWITGDQYVKPITDTDRLDWMIKHSAMVSFTENVVWCEVKRRNKVRSYAAATAREAIDMAIEEYK